MPETKPEPYYPRHEDWTPLPPEESVRATYWPAVLAAGILMLLWGGIASLILAAVGLIVFIVAAAGWIREIYYGGRDHIQ